MENQVIDIRVPDLGEVGEVRVVQWLRTVGATIAADEDLLEVETEKTTFVVPSPGSGRLSEVLAVAGATVQRGEVLGRIEQPG
jgi:pyruvate/2-oxoglutarate dehydrogenase complex dihydrolipoamide acyltransferase (E2) component